MRRVPNHSALHQEDLVLRLLGLDGQTLPFDAKGVSTNRPEPYLVGRFPCSPLEINCDLHSPGGCSRDTSEASHPEPPGNSRLKSVRDSFAEKSEDIQNIALAGAVRTNQRGQPIEPHDDIVTEGPVIRHPEFTHDRGRSVTSAQLPCSYLGHATPSVA